MGDIAADFELIGTHFVGVYYNVIYDIATRVTQKSDESIEEAYCTTARDYASAHRSAGSKRFYSDTVKGLVDYLRRYPQFATATHHNLVDHVTRLVIPEDYHALLKDSQKDKIMSDVINHVIADLAKFSVIPANLKRIVHDRNANSKTMVPEMQDHAKLSLFNKRGEFRSRLVQGGSKETVATKELMKTKQAVRELAERLAKEKKVVLEQKARIETLENTVKQLADNRTQLIAMLNVLGARNSHPPPPPEPAPEPEESSSEEEEENPPVTLGDAIEEDSSAGGESSAGGDSSASNGRDYLASLLAES